MKFCHKKLFTVKYLQLTNILWCTHYSRKVLLDLSKYVIKRYFYEKVVYDIIFNTVLVKYNGKIIVCLG